MTKEKDALATHPSSRSGPIANNLRYMRINEIEHVCRCFRNAYVAKLEGRAARPSSPYAMMTFCDKEWKKLCDFMFAILVTEGLVIPEMDEEEEEE